MTGRPCPICGKPGQVAFRPFCSARCADVDLNRWMSGLYSIEGDTDEDDDSTPRDPAEKA